MHITPEKCKWKLGNKRPIPGKSLKSTFQTAARWHSFTSEVCPTGVQHQVVFHRLFCTQGRMGWIILVLLESTRREGLLFRLGRVRRPWAHPHSMVWLRTTKAHGTFYSYYWGRSRNANHRKGRRNTGKSGHLSATQRVRECRSIKLSLIWGKGQTLLTTQLDSCKPPFWKQFSSQFVCTFVCRGMYWCVEVWHPL